MMRFSTGISRQHYLLVTALAGDLSANEERDTSRRNVIGNLL